MNEVLILVLNKKSSGIREQVYAATVKYIASNIPNSKTYEFSDNRELIEYIKTNQFSTVVYSNDIATETCFLLKGLGLVQILIGMRDDLTQVSDIIIDPLIYKSEKYLVGTKYLLPSIVSQVSVESLAEIIGIKPSSLSEDVSSNEAEIELIGIVKLYQKLEWDSNFFGINIGFITCLRLTPNIEKHIIKFIRREKLDLVEYRCNCHDRESVIASEKNGYSFVDMRLTFEKALSNEVKFKDKEGYSVSKGKVEDIEKLKDIVTNIYKHSRYYFDVNFDRNKVIDFYHSWVERAILGKFDDYAYVLYFNQEPVGFCTIKKIKNNSARIGLFGMSSKYTGKGLARHLLNISLHKLYEENVNYVEVVTQGRNYDAQKLYQRCGFVTKSTELWYHKWLC
ncbi:MAG: GNAT family N-acetyltransferase [Parcubacteria group bacterium]|nr:GNAT family N-acetyltransferase [Parcubacteria group bacterium]